MAFWDIFRSKDARANHSFSEKDRELALERRRTNIELENLRKKGMIDEETRRQDMKRLEDELRMRDLLDELEDFDDTQEAATPQMSVEDQLAMKLIDKIGFLRNPPGAPATSTMQPPPQTVTSTGAPVSVPDEKLKEIWTQIEPRYKSLAAQATDEQVKEFIQKQLIPFADDDTCNRALKIIRA